MKGAVIITHGRARRRMVGYACAVAAETARTNVPGLIADALREDAAYRDGRQPSDETPLDPPALDAEAERAASAS